MADKSISDLIQALQITGEDLFVLEQNGEAKKLKGEQLMDYVTLSVISVTVETLPAGSQATATYNKTTGELSLGIPQGAHGVKGDTGAQGEIGPQGETGATGATGATGPAGPANTLTIGTVTSGVEASATITGEAPNQVLNLVLKQGDKGDKGATGETGATGPQGPQGEQGIQGEQGEQGEAAPTITNITIRQSDYHMIVTLSDGTSYDAGYCRGASGAGTGDMLAATYDPQGKAQDIFAYIDNAVSGVTVTTDATPTQGSTNPVQSGGVYTALGDKLDKTGDGSNVAAAFTAASSRTNIATGEKLSVLFGKIAKWLSDLGSLAFKSTVVKTDLASDVQTSLGKADSALQSVPANYRTASAQDEIDNGKQDKITANGILKGDGAGVVSAAVKGADYSEPSVAFTVTLSASGWSGKAQTASDARFLTNGYAYSVAPDSGSFAAYGESVIYADNVTTAGQMQFHCGEVPTADLTVNILRMEAIA